MTIVNEKGSQLDTNVGTRMYFKNYCLHCPHQRTVNDASNGFHVCQDCGKVLEPTYADSSVHTHRLERPIESPFEEDLLEWICDKCYIDDAGLIRNIKLQWLDLKHQKKKSLHSVEALMLVAVFLALVKSDVPRPMQHLCQLTGIKPEKVWPYLNKQEFNLRPSLMCEYFLKTLNLPFKDVESIRKRVCHYERKIVFSPQTLIVACAYTFLRENKMSLNLSSEEKNQTIRPTFVGLARELGISPMALNGCVKRISAIE